MAINENHDIWCAKAKGPILGIEICLCDCEDCCTIISRDANGIITEDECICSDCTHSLHKGT